MKIGTKLNAKNTFYLILIISLTQALSGCGSMDILDTSCDNPAQTISGLDFNSIEVSTTINRIDIVNNDTATNINKNMYLGFKDYSHPNIMPSFDSQDLTAYLNGVFLPYSHTEKELPGGYGRPEYKYPYFNINTHDSAAIIKVTNRVRNEKTWNVDLKFDEMTLPIVSDTVIGDTLSLTIRKMDGVNYKMQALSNDTLAFKGMLEIVSSIDSNNLKFSLSDFLVDTALAYNIHSLYSASGDETINSDTARYWMKILYKAKSVGAIISNVQVTYKKPLSEKSTMAIEAFKKLH